MILPGRDASRGARGCREPTAAYVPLHAVAASGNALVDDRVPHADRWIAAGLAVVVTVGGTLLHPWLLVDADGRTPGTQSDTQPDTYPGSGLATARPLPHAGAQQAERVAEFGDGDARCRRWYATVTAPSNGPHAVNGR